MECSRRHYDGKCKSASTEGGFLWGWLKEVEFHEEFKKDGVPRTVKATWDQMDTLCKILEGEALMHTADKFLKGAYDKSPEKNLWFPMCQIFAEMRRQSERVNKPRKPRKKLRGNKGALVCKLT